MSSFVQSTSHSSQNDLEELKKQNSLLNDYIRTLEKENDSKTIEIRTITQQNEQLIAENQMIQQKSILSATQSRNSGFGVSGTSDFHVELTTKLSLLRTDYERLKSDKDQKQRDHKNEVENLQKKIAKMISEISFKSSQNQRLTQKIDSLTRNNQAQLRSLQTSQQQSSVSELTSANTKILTLQKKVSQLTSETGIKRSQIQRLNTKVRNQPVIEQQNQRLKQQIETLNAKISQLQSSNQRSQLTQSQLRQLNALKQQKLDWSKERQQLLVKISCLQTEIVQKSNQISQFKVREDFLKSNNEPRNVDSTAKDVEIQKLSSALRTLQGELQDQKRIISYRDSTIKALEANNQDSKTTTQQLSSLNRLVEEKNAQINRLVTSHNQQVSQLTFEIEKRRSNAQSNSAQSEAALKQEIAFLKRQSQNNMQISSELETQNKFLKLKVQQLERTLAGRQNKPHQNVYQSNTLASQHMSSKKVVPMSNGQGQSDSRELKWIISELHRELQDVRRSNKDIHQDNIQMQKYLAELSANRLGDSSRSYSPHFGSDVGSPSKIKPSHLSPLNIGSNSSLSANLGQSSLHEYQNSRSPKHQMQQKRQLQHKIINAQRHYEGSPKHNRSFQLGNLSSLPAHSQMSNGSGSVNKSKWEQLQRKISTLRVENDQLKKTLLYDD